MITTVYCCSSFHVVSCVPGSAVNPCTPRIRASRFPCRTRWLTLRVSQFQALSSAIPLPKFQGYTRAFIHEMVKETLSNICTVRKWMIKPWPICFWFGIFPQSPKSRQWTRNDWQVWGSDGLMFSLQLFTESPSVCSKYDTSLLHIGYILHLPPPVPHLSCQQVTSRAFDGKS